MSLTQSFNVDASGNEVISGSVSVTNFPATQPVSGTVAIGAGSAAIGTVALTTGSAAIGTVALTAGAAAIGSVTVSNFPASQAVTGTFFQATQPVSIAGTVSTTSAVATTGTLSSVAASAASTTVLASNAGRRGFSIFNDSTAICKIAFSATASAIAFTLLLQPNSFFESSILYTGVVSGIWTSAAGSARVTELT
jgi:hypothetical protein